MKAEQLINIVKFAIKNRMPLLIKGAPGIGKTDIVEKGCQETETDLIVSHPVVNDPTDYKGLPANNGDGTATFLPYGDLVQLRDAAKPTVFFLDDLGQAPASVQAAAMQLILARKINGHKVSDFVTFIAATNRKEDKAGVSGLLEPVKSRFASIVELEVNPDSWIAWAMDEQMPIELISFVRFRPQLIEKFEATKDITNSPSPRTIANVGKWQKLGLPKENEFEVFKGAAGEAFASEYCGFLKIFRNLPNIDRIILNPKTEVITDDPATLYALAGALSHRINESNCEAVITYIERLPAEIGVVTLKSTLTTKRELSHTKAVITWMTKHAADII